MAFITDPWFYVWLGVRLNTVISDVVFRRITLAILFSLGVRLLYEGLK